MEFKDIKDDYNKVRENERTSLSNYLIDILKHDERLAVVTRGSSGKGRIKYTSGRRFGKDVYDLSNWKWVEVRGKDCSCIISLNMLETDTNSGNVHALYDRIGFFVYTNNKNDGILTDERRIITDIELPLDDSKKGKIKSILENMVIKEMWKMEYPKNQE